MTTMIRFRLLLDLLAVTLNVACLAYWWLGNQWHEIFGALLLALVMVHNVFNRRWYGTASRKLRDPLRIMKVAMVACMAMAMTIMLVTSLLVSRDLFPLLALEGGFAVREVHMFAAYWTLLFIALHLGTRWTIVMNTVGVAMGLHAPSTSRTAALRFAALAIAAWGTKSSFDMAFGTKLMLSYSLDMWDFNESNLGFFVNYAAIVGLYAALVHYGMAICRWKGSRT